MKDKKEKRHLFYLKNKERILAKTKEIRKRWEIKNPDKRRGYVKKYKQRVGYPAMLKYKHKWKRLHPEQSKAYNKVTKAIQTGKLWKQPCFCGEIKVYAHHHMGYDEKNWLNIIWLCLKHHREAHKKI